MLAKLLLAFILCAQMSARAAIFNHDRREDISTNSSPEILLLARSTAIAVLNNEEVLGKDDFTLTTDEPHLCKDQKFANDRTLSNVCTGFLVGPDLIATSGHCYFPQGKRIIEDTGNYCGIYSWVFDYYKDANGRAPLRISKDKTYHCKRVIHAVEEWQAPWEDYALIQLDRPVAGDIMYGPRSPLKLSQTPVSGSSSRFFMISYPFGMPAKLSKNGQTILNNPANKNFVTSLDAFEGSSGAPVFNLHSEVVGILTQGTPIQSLVKDEQNSCFNYNKCDDQGHRCTLEDSDADKDAFRKNQNFQVTGTDVQRIDDLRHAVESVRQTPE